MLTKKAKWTVAAIIIIIVLNSISPALASANSPVEDAELKAQINEVVPVSIEMVDEALNVLAGGLSELDNEQREVFMRLYDPAKTGEVDEEFVASVVSNFEKIRNGLDGDLKVTYEADSDRCEGMRLYYTDLLKVHVCPYFKGEEDMNRKARVMIHEVAHKALLAADRHYYRPTNKAYSELTPKGSWAAQLPIVGKIFREIARGDTQDHPDAYAHFAAAVYSGDYQAVTGEYRITESE